MENQDGSPLLEVEVIPNSMALGAMVRAEIDSQITTAKMYPRDLSKFKNDAIAIVCMDESIAESCMYALKVDGKTITGPSVRLAEIIVSTYGNIKVAGRIISNNGNTIVVEAVCLDLEKNVGVSMPVTRSIRNKEGRQYSAHLQNVTTMAGLSIAYRNAVLKVVPLALTKVIQDAAKNMIAGAPADLPITRAKCLQFFQDTYKVSSDMILKSLGKYSIEAITLEDIVILKGYATAIRDQESTIEELFPSEKKPDEKQNKATEALKNTAGKVASEAKPKKAEAAKEPATEMKTVLGYKCIKDTKIIDVENTDVDIFVDEQFDIAEPGFYFRENLTVAQDKLQGNPNFVAF